MPKASLRDRQRRYGLTKIIMRVTPNKINAEIESFIELLGLNKSDAIFVKYNKVELFRAELENCHINNMRMKELQGGNIIYCWIILEDKIVNEIVGNFHSLWENNNGKLFDITPRRESEESILFVKDKSRSIEFRWLKGFPAIKTYDNVRLVDGKILDGIKNLATAFNNNTVYDYGLIKYWPKP